MRIARVTFLIGLTTISLEGTLLRQNQVLKAIQQFDRSQRSIVLVFVWLMPVFTLR